MAPPRSVTLRNLLRGDDLKRIGLDAVDPAGRMKESDSERADSGRHRRNGYLALWVPNPPGKHTSRGGYLSTEMRTPKRGVPRSGAMKEPDGVAER